MKSYLYRSSYLKYTITFLSLALPTLYLPFLIKKEGKGSAAPDYTFLSSVS